MTVDPLALIAQTLSYLSGSLTQTADDVLSDALSSRSRASSTPRGLPGALLPYYSRTALDTASPSAGLSGGDVHRNQSLPSSGDLIDGKYRVLGQLGAGGMGVVFEAVNIATEKHVAIKVLSPELSVAPEAAERFKREARATGRIHHPNVVAVHDCGDHDGRLYLVLELLKGEVLRAWMARQRVDLRTACQLLFPVMRGVAAAHAAGVLHRDLKPDNIFLAESPDGLESVPKVLDFGLAKLGSAADKASQLSAVGSAMGTYQFMAPEQLRSVGELDERVDVYAMGAIFFQMIAGRPPYSADNPVDLALQIVASEAAPISRFASVPPGATEVIARSLVRNRNARFTSMEEFAVALEPFAGGISFRGYGRRSQSAPAPQAAAYSVTEQFNVAPLSTPYRPSPTAPPKPPRARWPLALVATALGTGVLLIAGRFALQQTSTAPVAGAPAPAATSDPGSSTEASPSAPPRAVDPQRPLAPTPVLAGEGITFEEPEAAAGDWAGTQETWPSPLPESRGRRSADPLPEARPTSADDVASDARRESRHRGRRRSLSPQESPGNGTATVVATPPPPTQAAAPAERERERAEPSGRRQTSRGGTVLITDDF